jgi:hypothetical protein
VNLDITELCRVIFFAEGNLGDLEVYHAAIDKRDRGTVPTRFMAQVNLVF